MSKKFECYEIWRPNIPDNGCNKQCKECKEKQSINFKDMSRDKPTGWAVYVAIWFIVICLQIHFDVWNTTDYELYKPLMIYGTQVIGMVAIIIYKFTKD